MTILYSFPTAKQKALAGPCFYVQLSSIFLNTGACNESHNWPETPFHLYFIQTGISPLSAGSILLPAVISSFSFSESLWTGRTMIFLVCLPQTASMLQELLWRVGKQSFCLFYSFHHCFHLCVGWAVLIPNDQSSNSLLQDNPKLLSRHTGDYSEIRISRLHLCPASQP